MDFRHSLTRQKGSALVFAMGLCTLVAILATSMIFSLHKDMRRFDKMQSTVIEYASLRSATAWAISILSDEAHELKTDQTLSITLNGQTLVCSLEEKVQAPDEESDEASEAPPQEFWLKTVITAKNEREIYTLLKHSAEQGWQVVERKMGAPS